MTAVVREIARSERTLQSMREFGAQRVHFRFRNRAKFLQFGVVTTLSLGFVKPRFKVIGIRQPPTYARRIFTRGAVTGRVRKSAIKWNCRRSGVESGECS